MKQGDEWFHWMADLDGNLMMRDAEGFYRLATKQQTEQWNAERLERIAQRNEASEQLARRRQTARAARHMTADDTMSDSTSTDSDTTTFRSHFDFPTTGQIRGIVVLVEYQDVRFSIPDPLQQYTDMMMKPGYDYASDDTHIHQGSANDYFRQNSFGIFDPQFDVYGPLLLKNDRAYYGKNTMSGNDQRPYAMIIEACEQLDSLGVDFTQYDNDHDGAIDFVFAFYAGEGENSTAAGEDAVWPHQWNVISAGGGKNYYDDLLLESYACTCELYKDRLDGVGTFCHEFSHVLGLPDLYDVNYQAFAPYNYSVLDNGCYLNSGYCPAGYSTYERYELGWIEPTVMNAEPSTFILDANNIAGQALIVPVTEGLADPRDGEYYIFENRQKTGWDRYLPGHGMVVWHIDYTPSKWTTNHVNTWRNHQCVDLVEADGARAKQDASATFPGSKGHTEFTDDTKPAFSGWSHPCSDNSTLANRLGMPITNIREFEYGDALTASITFDLLGGEPEALERIEQDIAPARGIVLLNNQFVIQTSVGHYDLLGRSVR